MGAYHKIMGSMDSWSFGVSMELCCGTYETFVILYRHHSFLVVNRPRSQSSAVFEMR
jgi:hypothetical protein